MKFKVGDRVEAVKDDCGVKQGDKGTVIGIADKGADNISVEFDRNIRGHAGGLYGTKTGKIGHCRWLHPCDIILIAQPSIHITADKDGKTTHAVLKEGSEVVKMAKSVCAPGDTYSFETGANIACRRLYDPSYTPAAEPELQTTWAAFEQLARPLVKWLNNFNPHHKIIIEPDGAELMGGEMSVHIEDYIKD